MAIKARIPTGEKHKRTDPLYQWDYGQTLEIEADNLPSIVEVHFACHGMTEAVVHTCSAVNGVVTVAIPDRCLEQASEITAWVYEIEGTAGRTIYSISIPITARTRPARSESIPQSVQDTYTQLIDAVNGLLESMQSGTINVGHANTATSANTAGSANRAVNDGDGNKISDTYVKVPSDYVVCTADTELSTGLYVFRVFMLGSGFAEMHTLLIQIGGSIAECVYSGDFCFNNLFYRLKFDSGDTDGATYDGIQSWDETSGAWVSATVSGTVSYKKIL